VLRSMFNTGQALPLGFTRFLGPRMSRGEYAKQPRNIARSWPRTRPVHDHEQSTNQTQAQPIRVRELSMSALSPRQQARSHSFRIRDHITVSTVRGQALAADTHSPQTVRSLAPSMSANSSRPRICRDPRLASHCPRRRMLDSILWPTHFPVRLRSILSFSSYVLV
jgi:hypothetical protein